MSPTLYMSDIYKYDKGHGRLYRAVNCLLKAPVFRGLNICIVYILLIQMDRPFNANKPNFCSCSIYVVANCGSLYYVSIKKTQIILIRCCQNEEATQLPANARLWLVLRRCPKHFLQLICQKSWDTNWLLSTRQIIYIDGLIHCRQ